MSRSEAELDFVAWDCGWSFAFFGTPWVRVLPHLARDLCRPLTGDEQQEVRRGYLAGRVDREQFARDQAERDAAGVAVDEIPF